MAILVKEKKQTPAASQTRSFGRGHLPAKRSINLAGIGEKKIDLKIALPAILLILLAAALFSKFAVVDRLSAVSRANAEVAQLRGQLEAGYARLSAYDELEDEYAHYTYEGLTKEELNRADRVAVLDLMRRVVLPSARVESWTISSNTLTMTVTGRTLQSLNTVSQKLEAEELVDFCTVTMAATSDLTQVQNLGENTDVTAMIVAYLKNAEEGGGGK